MPASTPYINAVELDIVPAEFERFKAAILANAAASVTQPGCRQFDVLADESTPPHASRSPSSPHPSPPPAAPRALPPTFPSRVRDLPGLELAAGLTTEAPRRHPWALGKQPLIP